MKNKICTAFSLVELMVTLIVVACLTAALSPIITKKLKSREITISNGGSSSSSEISTSCDGLFGDDCKLCNINYCLQCEKTCSDGYYKNIPRCNCTSCTTYDSNCETCDSIGCLTCKGDFKLENDVCKLKSTTKEFITAGNHEFVVPDGINELYVTLVSGGAGAAGVLL